MVIASASTDRAVVHDTDAAIVSHQHVAWLEVPMHEPCIVGRLKAAPRPNECVDHRCLRSRLVEQPALQRTALHVLHRDEVHAVDLSNLEDRDHAGVLQLRERLRLALEPLGSPGRAPLEQLECDHPVECGVPGRQHDAHAAGPHMTLQLVAPERIARLRQCLLIEAARARRDRLVGRERVGLARVTHRPTENPVPPHGLQTPPSTLAERWSGGGNGGACSTRAVLDSTWIGLRHALRTPRADFLRRGVLAQDCRSTEPGSERAMLSQKNVSQAVYSIGALASLTGLSPSTIRTWERRYRAVEPSRTDGGGRRYNEHDVERVQLLLALTRGGEAISVVAQLSLESLRARVQQHQALRPDVPTGIPRVGLIHPSLGGSFSSANVQDVQLVRTASSLGAFRRDAVPALDFLLVELGLLGDDPESQLETLLEETGAATAVVEYGFARRATLEALAHTGAQVARGPLSVADVLRLAKVHAAVPRRSAPFVAPSVPSDPPAPRFNAARLARLREINTNTDCECPNHVATLVTALTSFEEYSKTCVSTQPEDAELHAGLAYGTSRARAVMEELLMRLCEYEGIEL